MQQEHNDALNEMPVLPEMNETETLMHEMRRLLVHCEGALYEEGVRAQAETLERWLESYRRGLAAAQKLSKNSVPFLQEMRQRLTLSLEELQRLEDEGGAPATPEQKARIEDINRAIARIDRLTISLADASFQGMCAVNSDAELV